MTACTRKHGLTVRTSFGVVEYAPAPKFRSEHGYTLVYGARLIVQAPAAKKPRVDWAWWSWVSFLAILWGVAIWAK